MSQFGPRCPHCKDTGMIAGMSITTSMPNTLCGGPQTYFPCMLCDLGRAIWNAQNTLMLPLTGDKNRHA